MGGITNLTEFFLLLLLPLAIEMICFQGSFHEEFKGGQPLVDLLAAANLSYFIEALLVLINCVFACSSL